MAFEFISSFLFEKIFQILPRTLSRLFISPKKIAAQIEIDLRSSNPIDISFGGEIPDVSLYFRITNKGPVDLELDRVLVDFWVGQPTIKGAILMRQNVRRRSTIDDVFFTAQLSSPQQDQIKRKIEGKIISEKIHITADAYFNSKIGTVHIRKFFERRDVICH